MFFSTYKYSLHFVDAGIDTLMSISDGSGPSVFCQKRERMRPEIEEMDRKVV